MFLTFASAPVAPKQKKYTKIGESFFLRAVARMSSPAERMRAKRRRDAEGRAILPIEVPVFDLADALVDAGLLQAWDADDKEKIRAATERLLRTFIAEFSTGGRDA